MNIKTLRAQLVEHGEKQVRFLLPDGDPIPAEAHVTEVGHVAKRFIDCGGTVRSQEACLLQVWVADDDQDHRLEAGKLAHILELSRQVLPSDELGVEVEYERCAVGQYTVDAAEVRGGELVFTLGNKKTDCLARESCGLEVNSTASGTGCGCGEGKTQCC